ncbi:MAG TPA: 3' terminal RNA ribose 2'-O-methyltransferase Hen1 [Drouetiella sp.]
MLLTISTTQEPATDLGFLLHKNPSQVQSFDLSFGQAHVFYPEASVALCTVAVMLDVDPVSLVRGKKDSRSEGGVEQYVNDRPYVASSFLSVAIAQLFRSAMNGTSKERPELAETEIPLVARVSVIPCRAGESYLRELFEPLGYDVEVSQPMLDQKFIEWGRSRYFELTLRKTCKLKELLGHLYVLMPVLDNDKHYYVGEEEVEKLLRHGEGWLNKHPRKNDITKKYLKHRHSLVRKTFERLSNDEEIEQEEHASEKHTLEEEKLEEKISLNERRIGTVVSVLKQCNASRVVDLGCGGGKLLKALLEEKEFTQITGMDVSHRALEIAHDRLYLDRMPEMKRARIQLIQGSLTYRDSRIAHYDAATLIEVIEHLDEPRLAALEKVVFKFAKPSHVVITTPNVEYNAKFETLPAGQLRHKDHRFEWTREQFETWCGRIAITYGYSVRFLPVGDLDPDLGAPTQMGIFSR